MCPLIDTPKMQPTHLLYAEMKSLEGYVSAISRIVRYMVMVTKLEYSTLNHLRLVMIHFHLP